MLRKKLEINTAGGGGVVDTNPKPEPIDLAPCVPVLGKLPDQSDGGDVFDPLSLRVRDPEPQHPGLSFLAAYCFE
jgi:hypothetical protein